MKNYIENFDNFKLPDIELSKEELGEIKEVVIREGMLRAVKKLIKYNTRIKINFTDEEIVKIYKKIQEAEISKDRGFKDRIFLRTLVVKTLEKEVLEKNNIIVKSSLLYDPKLMKIPYWFRDRYYIQIYLTKDKIIKYEMTNSFDVVGKEEIPLSEIISAGVYAKRRKFWTIQFKYRDISWPVTNDFVSKEFGDLVKELNNLGISEKKIKV